MPKIDGKFLKNIPQSKNFSNEEIVMSNQRIDWSLGNVFKREITPIEDNQTIRFKFRNLENFRQILLTVVNMSETLNANVYFPLGFWGKDGVPVTLVKPLQRMSVRITSINNEIYYEVENDLVPYVLPFERPQILEEFGSRAPVGPYSFNWGSGFHSLTDIFNPDHVYLGFEEESYFRPIIQQSNMAIEHVDGTYSAEISEKLSDVLIEAFCFNEDMSIAYVWGCFGNHYLNYPLDPTPNDLSTPRLLAIDMESGEPEVVADLNVSIPVLHSLAYSDGKVYLKAQNSIFCVNAETGLLEWQESFSAFPSQSSHVKIVGNYLYHMVYTQGGVDGDTSYVTRRDKTTGTVDNGFHASVLPEILSKRSHQQNSWHIDSIGRAFTVTGTELNYDTQIIESHLFVINPDGTFESYPIEDSQICYLEYLTNDTFKTLELVNGQLTLRNRSLSGDLISTEISSLPFNTSHTCNSLITASEKTYISFGTKFYTVVGGQLDSSFNKLRYGDVGYLTLAEDYIILKNYSRDGLDPNPLVYAGEIIPSGTVIKYDKMNEIELGRFYNPEDPSLSHMEVKDPWFQLQTHPDKLFLRFRRGFVMIDTQTMTLDNSWNLLASGDLEGYFVDGYIYCTSYSPVDLLSSSNQILKSISKHDIVRFDIANNEWDLNFQVTLDGYQDNNAFYTGIQSTPDYLYVTYANGFGNGQLYQIKKSDLSFSVVPNVSSKGRGKPFIINSIGTDLILLECYATGNFVEHGLDVSSNFVDLCVLKESDQTVQSTSPFYGPYYRSCYDGQGNLFYWRTTGSSYLDKFTKVDVFTMIAHEYSEFSLLQGQWGSKSRLLSGEWNMWLEDGYVYMNLHGYYNRRNVYGIVKFNPVTETLG